MSSRGALHLEGFCFEGFIGWFCALLSLSWNSFLKFYLVLTVLGLHCCAWSFRSGGERRLLSSCSVWASHGGGFSCCGAQAQELWHLDVAAQGRVASFLGQTHVLCIGLSILKHWSSKAVLELLNTFSIRGPAFSFCSGHLNFCS